MSPFDFVNSVSKTKKNMMRGTENDTLAEKSYVPFITNKSLSYFADSIMYANEMNQRAHLDNLLQYEYFLNTLRPNNRFAKWAKKDESDVIDIVMQYYQCSERKAIEIIPLLNDEHISFMKQKLQQGGVENGSTKSNRGAAKTKR